MTNDRAPILFRPTKPELEPDTFLRRYERNRAKHSQASHGRDAAPARRRSRRDDPAREARRRQKLSDSYTIAIDRVAELSAAQAMLSPASESGAAKVREWLPEKAERAYFGLCTLGEALDLHMRELVESDMAAAAILNEVALAWVVAITQEVRERVGAKVQPEGFRVGAAYRPGLGRWPLQVQKTIFAEMPTQQIGVTLTESLLMLPSFSTSLVIPIIPNPSAAK